MRCEVVAIGTELLLGQIVDTNSSWMGEQLAAIGIDSLMQTKVGDNQQRIVAAIDAALERADAVICCGGLGPTQDDITRESIAEVLGVRVERDPDMIDEITAMFRSRDRAMPITNERQAERPLGADWIHNDRGTAPGLICEVDRGGSTKVIYAVPGVPHEMQAMLHRVVLPDLVKRSGETAVIASRVLRTWGLSEAAIGETVAPRIDALNEPGAPAATIAFLASGMEGIKVRVTAKASNQIEVTRVLDAEEKELRALIGDVVFGVDDENMERVVARLLGERGLTLAVAESLTGGLIASRLVSVPGASAWFRGGIVAYSSDVKFSMLDVPVGPVVSAEAASAMAIAVRRQLGADIGLSVTGVAGPTEQDGQPAGTAFVGLSGRCLSGAAAGLDDEHAEVAQFHLPGDRERVRQYVAITALNFLRQQL
jgi:nicotinamide-nucleotide amidase